MQNKLQKQFLTRIKIDLPLELFILPSPHSPTGLLAQQEHSVEWIYTCFRGINSLTPYLDLIALIIINRKRTKTLIGFEIISNFSTCRPLPITHREGCKPSWFTT